MNRKTKILILVLALSALIALLFGGVRLYQNIKQVRSSTFQSLPEGLALAIKIHKPSALFSQLHGKNQIWECLKEFDEIKILDKEILIIDSVVNSNDRIKQLLTDKGIMLSLHFAGENRFSLFLSVELPQTSYRKNIIGFFEALGELHTGRHKGVNTYNISLDEERNLHFAITNGLFLGSLNKLLLNQSIDRLKEKLDRETYDNLIQSAKFAGADMNNLFINPRFFSRLLMKYSSNDFIRELGEMQNILVSTGLDISIRNNSWGFNGYTVLPDTGKGLLNALHLQSPASSEVKKILPLNTAMALFAGFDNMEELSENIKPGASKSISGNTLTDPITDIFSWTANQLCYFVVGGPNENMQNTFLAIQCKDPREAGQKLRNLSLKADDFIRSDTLSYRNFTIRRTATPELWGSLLGKPFNNITKNYFTIIENYVIFANDKTSLSNLINTYLLERTLDKDKTYQEFSQYILDESNLYLYINYSVSPSFINSFLSNTTADAFHEKQYALNRIQAVGIQFLNRNGRLYTNIQMYHSASAEESVGTAWDAALDANLALKPYRVIDHNTRTGKLLVFDHGPSVYMLSMQGEILWKTDLPEMPVSDVHMVDAYKNNRIQYLFNSENYLFLLDRNGNFVDGYPLRLDFRASAGMAVFDYENKRDYRLVIPAYDRKVYNLSVDGKAVRGWQTPQTTSIVQKAVQHIVLSGKDFILISDTSGNVIFANRRGETRIKPEPDFTHARHSKFFKDRSGKYIISSDIAGRLVFIDHNGRTEKKTLAQLNDNHHFIYADISGNKIPEYIFFQDNVVRIYDAGEQLIKTFELESAVINNNVYEYISGKENNTIAVITDKQSVIVLNTDGICDKLPELKTESGFLSTVELKGGKVFIITGRGRIVNCYPL